MYWYISAATGHSVLSKKLQKALAASHNKDWLAPVLWHGVSPAVTKLDGKVTVMQFIFHILMSTAFCYYNNRGLDDTQHACQRGREPTEYQHRKSL